MNVPLPNFTLQYSQPDLSIYHQNVIGGNIQGTDYVNGFPVTNTGTSLGMYQHLGIDGQNNKRTDFLNVSGTQSGGYNFWTSNATDAPILLASMTKDGIGNASNRNFLQLKENNGQLQFYNGSVATEVTTGQLAVSNQATGFTTIITPQSLNTTLTTGGNVTGQTVLTAPYADNNYNGLVSSGLHSRITTTCPDNQPNIVVTDDISAAAYLYKDHLQVNSSGAQSNYYSNHITINNGTYTSAQLYGSTGGILTLTDNTNTAVLSPNDLTFNTVSLKSTVSTNTSNISTNTSAITALTIKQISTINQYISAAIYADGRPPTAPSTTIAQTYAYTPSWYFKNTTAGYKINWYSGATTGLTVGDILGLYIAFFNGNNTSNDNTPFLTVYTTPTGSGDYAPGFYHSACTYVFDGTIAANSRYVEFLNLHSCPTPNYYGSTLRSMIQSPVSPNPRGTYASTETVGFFAIGSNSAAAVNSVEFAVSKFGVMLASGTTEINYFPN